MELEGFIRAMNFFKNMKMKIHKLVTDRHA